MADAPRLAVMAGTFDPLTNGHLDVIARAARLFGRVVVAVLVNPAKAPLFALEDRMAMIREAVAPIAGAEVDAFDGLLADYVKRRQASAVVRGLRTASEFADEWPVALMNRHLNPACETVFVVPSAATMHVSSRLVREIAALGGPVDGLGARGRRAAAAAATASAVRRMMTGARVRLAERIRHVGLSPTMKGDDRGRAAEAAGRRTSSISAPASRTSRRRRTSWRPRAPRSTPASPSTPRTWARSICARPSARATGPTTASEYAPDEVIVTAGGKQALFHAALALFGPGDEVIMHAPGWPTLGEQVKLAGATPVVVQTRRRERLRADGGGAPGGRHAAHARHRDQLADQPDRGAARRGRGAGPRGRGVAAGPLDRDGPLLRAARLRPRAAQPAAHHRNGDARSARAVRLGVEDVRDDRLAVRLAAGAAGRSWRRPARSRATRPRT